MNKNVTDIKTARKEDMLPVGEWAWDDFRNTWEVTAEATDKDTAWKLIFDIWQIRAGEIE